MSAFKVVCSECNKEEVFIESNTYTGRTPRSVANREKKRHIRNQDHATEDEVIVKQGGWDSWLEEFVDKD